LQQTQISIRCPKVLCRLQARQPFDQLPSGPLELQQALLLERLPLAMVALDQLASKLVELHQGRLPRRQPLCLICMQLALALLGGRHRQLHQVLGQSRRKTPSQERRHSSEQCPKGRHRQCQASQHRRCHLRQEFQVCTKGRHLQRQDCRRYHLHQPFTVSTKGRHLQPLQDSRQYQLHQPLQGFLAHRGRYHLRQFLQPPNGYQCHLHQLSRCRSHPQLSNSVARRQRVPLYNTTYLQRVPAAVDVIHRRPSAPPYLMTRRLPERLVWEQFLQRQ